nr:hypothetical protein [Marinicella sp. W31]MDC2877036.1 hypothetical protein [Marinicella sp. W31]
MPPPGPNTSYQPWVYDKFTFGDLLGKMAQDRTRSVVKDYRGFLDAQVVLPTVGPALAMFAVEFSYLLDLFGVSATYHGMDYVIATFEQYLDSE